jgi:beta-aspartyl-peptidase (threonine type)
MSEELEATYRAFLDDAITRGYEELREGRSGLDVVVSVIQMMEDSPLFNAGRGAVYTWEGTHELDASIMHGENLDAGAVAGVSTVKSPIALARAVMEDSPHVMLAGAGRRSLRPRAGALTLCPLSILRQSAAVRHSRPTNPMSRQACSPRPIINLAPWAWWCWIRPAIWLRAPQPAGMTGKRWGRIGDSPVIGAGTYADNRSCAVSATGHGEYFIRHTVARDICARMQFGDATLEEAAQITVMEELVKAGGEGGVVAADSAGKVALIFNTPGMYRASIDAAGLKVVGIYGDDKP